MKITIHIHNQLLLLFGCKRMSGKSCWRRIRLYKRFNKSEYCDSTPRARQTSHKRCTAPPHLCDPDSLAATKKCKLEVSLKIINRTWTSYSTRPKICPVRCDSVALSGFLETSLDLKRCQEILWDLKRTIRCWQYVDNIYNIGNIVNDGFRVIMCKQ